MLRSFWRSVDRFSLPHFKYVINELQSIEDVDSFNTEVVVDLLQSVVEIVTFGDKHDPLIFECFMEHQVLAEFVRMLKISRNSRVEAEVLQYLSILIQNLQSEHAIYYCLSNGYINNIITHEYEFQAGDIILYYVSFLRTLGQKLNGDTICLLMTVQEWIVTSFPLYTHALRFAHHGEKLIQTAIRSLTLTIYEVGDEVVCRFLMAPPQSEYFSDLALKLREESVHLDTTVNIMRNNRSIDKREEFLSLSHRLLDDLYYVKDLLCVAKSCLSTFVTKKLLGLLVVPILIPLSQLGGIDLSALPSLCFLSRLLQVLDKKEMFDSVACLILYPYVALTIGDTTSAGPLESYLVKLSCEHVKRLEHLLCSYVEFQDVEKMLWRAAEQKLSALHSNGYHQFDLLERNGIVRYILSNNLVLVLASLMLLFVLADSDDMDNLVAVLLGFPQKHNKTEDDVVSELLDRSMLIRCMPQILNTLLNNVGTTTSSPVTQWHIGWFILKLLNMQRSVLRHHELHLSIVRVQLNVAFLQACERLLKELSGSWFDFIPAIFQKEWKSCKTALESSSRNKDPFFVLEIAFGELSSDGDDIDAWQRMVDSVKIFVLHLQLKAYIATGSLPDDSLGNLQSTSSTYPRDIYDSDSFSLNFGSKVSLASACPCKISFSKVGVKDIYMLPVAKGISGKLLLVEKHPFHSRHGLVFATAPLAGITPMIDEAQTTWLHLNIREFSPKIASKIENLNNSKFQRDARWTIGFSDAEACEAANLLIAQETYKQRSCVESLLAPFLNDSYLIEKTVT